MHVEVAIMMLPGAFIRGDSQAGLGIRQLLFARFPISPPAIGLSDMWITVCPSHSPMYFFSLASPIRCT
jgi:hypothetical protein